MRRSSMLKQRTILLAILLILGGSLFVAGSSSHAATVFSVEPIGEQTGLTGIDLKQLLINIIRWVLGIVTLAAVGYLIYGGILWMTSRGDEKKIEKAKQTILQATIGLVIILLAWAIVFFVTKTLIGVTTNSDSGDIPPGCTLACGGNATKFDIIAINTCAPLPPATAVPRSSAVSFTFNSNLKTWQNASTMDPPQTIAEANDPIKLAVENGHLRIQQCLTDACTSFAPDPVPPSLDPTPIVPATMSVPQTFSGNMKASTDAVPLSEWVVIDNTLTFYHLTSPNPADKNFFASDTSYLVTLPKGDGAMSDGIRDIRDRLLSLCRARPTSVASDIPGCEEVGDQATGALTFKFKTGTDIAGQGIKVNGGTPSNDYKRIPLSARVDRAVPKTSSIGVFFNGGIDPTTVNENNIQLFKMNTAPDDTRLGTCGGGECMDDLEQIDPNLLDASPVNGNGAQLVFKETGPLTTLLPYQWYKVVVKDIRNLCGTAMDETPYSWVFQTNNVMPGVDSVYPENEGANYCPSTPVMINYNTSMFNPPGNTCTVGDPNSHETQAILLRAGLAQVPGNWDFIDPPPPPAIPPVPIDLNRWCKHLIFKPTAELTPNSTFNGWTAADMPTDVDFHTIDYGDIPTGFVFPSWRNPDPDKAMPWHFDVTTADMCYQKPYVTSVIPGQDANGACVSVSGGFFEKPAPKFTDLNPGKPETGDRLDFSSVNQSFVLGDPDASDIKAWSNTTIVNKLNTGSPALPATVADPYHYKVSVNYPAPIGVLESDDTTLASSFILDDGLPSDRPCLYSLSPDQGPPGTANITATGEKFGTVGGSIETTNSSPWPYSGGWTDTKILGISVPLDADHPVTTPVSVRVGLVDSNPIDFQVTDPPTVGPGTAPEVVESNSCEPPSTFPSPNPYRDDAQACINAKVIVRFNVPLEGATVDNTSVKLFSCIDAANCPVEIGINAPSTAGNMITFEPTADLAPGTLYEGRLSTGIRALPAPLGSGLPMAAQYTWQFTTKAGPPCEMDTLNLTPNGAQTTNNPNYTIAMLASPLDTTCHALKLPAGMSYNWDATNPPVGGLLPPPLVGTIEDKKVLGPIPPPAASGNTVVHVDLQSLVSPTFTLTYDPTACTDDGQCQVNPLCSQSTCVSNVCTPVITGVDKPDGEAGAYNTILGCWFGNVAGQVHYGTEDGMVPDPLLCGTNTWTNEKIIREVPTPQPDPDFLGSVNVEVIRPDLQAATRNNGFEYSGTNYPTICGINPVSGNRGFSPVKISGKDFGSAPTVPAGGRVDFIQNLVPVRATYTPPGWQDDGNGITVRVPALAAFGDNEVRVSRGGGDPSNPVSFNVLNPSILATCTNICNWPDDTNCTLLGQACTYNNQPNGLGCCAPRPRIIDVEPNEGDTSVCRNTVAKMTFDLPLDPSKVTAGPTGSVQYQDGATVVNGSVAYRTTVGNRGEISYYPGLLSAGAGQRMSLLPNRIRGADGVLADIAGSPLNFTTGDNICTVDRVEVLPANTLFTAVGQTASLEAQAYSNTQAAAIVPVPGLYTWNWSWASKSPPVVTAAMTPDDPTNNPSESTITAVANGRTTVTATATIDTDTVLTPSTSGRTVEGQSDVDVSFCVLPWFFTDTANNCDITGLGCKDYNFRLFYCRDAGDTPLPDFIYQGVSGVGRGSIEGINASDPTRLKTYFFKETATSRDTIGIMIFRNDGFLSPYDWFKKRFPLDTGGSSMVIGNYPAVKSGTTTYIGVTNYRSGNDQLEGLMFLFDYNSNNASSETVQIADKMLDMVLFDLNLTGTPRDQLIHDTRRRQDLTSMKLLLNAYQTKNSTYPNLAAGSYIPGFSTSLWPSWQAALGVDLATTVPLDPINKFSANCADPYEAATCWSEPKKEFICPLNPPNADSSIYAYKFGAANSANLYATMEFSDGAMASFKSTTRPTSICSSPSSCDCFNFTLPVTSAGSSFVLQNPDFEAVGAGGVPTGWGTSADGVISQSADVPPGNEDGHSVLADCSGCAANQQAYVIQTQTAMDPVGTTYRVTGWVKTEQLTPLNPLINRAGLFTACMDGDPPPLPALPRSFNNCGYSLAPAPGVFRTTAGSGGWRYIDYAVTKKDNAWATLHVDCFADAGNQVWCDDITVTRVDG